MSSRLSAGVARADITPPIGIGHAGWGAQTHQRAAGIDLPLWITALALSDGECTTVIIDIDCMYLFEREATAVRNAVTALTGLPEANVRLAYTHTHSGPVSGNTWSAWMSEGAEMVTGYDARLCDEAAGVAWAAINRLQPVRVKAGRGTSTIGVNRRFQRPGDGVMVVGRNWSGPVDSDVQVLRFDTMDCHPLATIVNYACHPITVGPDNDLVTPDFPGVVKRVVEQATGSTCLFLQGAAGDIGPIRGGARNGAQEYKRLGAMLGHEASRMWWEIGAPQRNDRYLGTLESGAPLAIYADDPIPDPDRSLHVISRVVDLPTRQIGDPDRLDVDFTVHLDNLDRSRNHGTDEEVREQTMRAKRAGMRARLARKVSASAAWSVEIQGIALGQDIALFAAAVEPFVEIGRQVKQASPFPGTLFSGYSNVGWAYMPTADAYPLGGYEVEVTPFAPEAADAFVAASVELLDDLYAKVSTR